VNTCALVDTNVVVASTGRSHVSSRCRALCDETLAEFVSGLRTLVLDEPAGARKTIFEEYRAYLGGEPTVGREFLLWVLTNQWDSSRVHRVTVTPVDEPRGYAEFPDHPGLVAFDASDRKFVAAAVAHGAPSPPIFEAADSKWIGWEDALTAAGINVTFLCKGELAAVHAKKFSSAAATGRRGAGKKPKAGGTAK